MAKQQLAARKTPRQQRSIATVEAILQAATYILTKRGWDALTTNAVARKAGVNISSLYQYFPNKESIVAELQRRHVAQMRALWPVLPSDASLSEFLRAVIETAVAEHQVNPALHRVFAEELPRASRNPSLHADLQRRWDEQVTPHVEVPDVELAGFVARVATHAVIHEAATQHPELLAHPLFVSELVELLEGYLTRGKPSHPSASQVTSACRGSRRSP